jgi:hypothetical protein
LEGIGRAAIGAAALGLFAFRVGHMKRWAVRPARENLGKFV